jgi:hypothetical protein
MTLPAAKRLLEAASATAPDTGLQLFFGPATETEARVYAHWDDAANAGAAEGTLPKVPTAPATVRLSGMLRGPECRYAHTLPVNFPLNEMPPTAAATTPGRLAEAWIPDPCFWTPAMPFLYRYELRRDELSSTRQTTGIVGIRRLGASGANLLLDRKRWVLRAARTRELNENSLAGWHDSSLAAVVESPDDALCEAASRLGVLLVADLSAPGIDLAAELVRLRRWPAVGVAIVADEKAASPLSSERLRRLARNLLFAQRASADRPIMPASWAQMLFCDFSAGGAVVASLSNDGALAANLTACTLPVVAVRSAESSMDPMDARANCDRLQGELAAAGIDLAGYVV